MNLDAYLEARRQVVDRELAALVDLSAAPQTLAEAMRYSLFPGGKRIRPVLALAANEAVGGCIEDTLPIACAIEMIHAYSLVHDDLPCMDDDDLRRGRPTCHRVFGEAVALLAGDALLTEAFRVIARGARRRAQPIPKMLEVLEELAEAAGAAGMVGGQVRDLEAQGREADLASVEAIHRGKTAALIRVAVRAGAVTGGASGRELEALTAYGESLGLAFQVADDILDEVGDTEKTGKRPRRDSELGKATYPAVAGLAAAKRRVEELREECLEALSAMGEAAEALRAMARYVVGRALTP